MSFRDLVDVDFPTQPKSYPADYDQVRKAFEQLALKHHPALTGDMTTAEQFFDYQLAFKGVQKYNRDDNTCFLDDDQYLTMDQRRLQDILKKEMNLDIDIRSSKKTLKKASSKKMRRSSHDKQSKEQAGSKHRMDGYNSI